MLVLPYVFGFRLVPRKEVLKDVTIVTLVRMSHRFEGRFRSSPVKRWNEDDEAINYEKNQRI